MNNAAESGEMEEMMTRFAFGDQVRHPRRPEWGTGRVTAVEAHRVNGRDAQRVSVRFSNEGLKTIVTATVQLELVTDEDSNANTENDQTAMNEIDNMANSGWLAGVAEQKISERMIELPSDVRDAFDRAEVRLARTIDLFRFDRSGRGLMSWAIAQSGLNDPLVRFSRQELEQFFDRWESARDEHLRALVREAGQAALQSALAKHSRSLQMAVTQVTSGR